MEAVCKQEQEHVTNIVTTTQLAIPTTLFQKLKVVMISPALQVRRSIILSDIEISIVVFFRPDF